MELRFEFRFNFFSYVYLICRTRKSFNKYFNMKLFCLFEKLSINCIPCRRKCVLPRCILQLFSCYFKLSYWPLYLDKLMHGRPTKSSNNLSNFMIFYKVEHISIFVCIFIGKCKIDYYLWLSMLTCASRRWVDLILVFQSMHKLSFRKICRYLHRIYVPVYIV